MRIKFLLKSNRLPILYRHIFMSLIKEALKRADADYKAHLYPDKSSDHSKVPKPFCFNVSLPPGWSTKQESILIENDMEIEDTVFYFPQGSSLSFYVSSSDPQFIIHLYNGLLSLKSFSYGRDINIEFERAFSLNEKKITQDEVVFKTNAPILIEDSDGRPLLPSADNLQAFNDHFNAIHDRILKDLRGGQGLYRKVEFTSVNLKKQVVKHTLKGFREKTGKPYMLLTCFQGSFKIKGDPRDLQMLYQAGMGLRRGQGFGMVEVV